VEILSKCHARLSAEIEAALYREPQRSEHSSNRVAGFKGALDFSLVTTTSPRLRANQSALVPLENRLASLPFNVLGGTMSGWRLYCSSCRCDNARGWAS
jgi:hypothetical protein